ncbi:hypothetical protein [Dyella sp. ASV21]|uniref:hypothetical protein n=1 Tax=Dyella sp. ASV21 TaxID=2795114 RepID=UPI0018EC63F9|nr:hypothetical protein [Dyella sp. ASV21]
MDHRCLVLSGRLLDEQDAATVHARMAAAFGMELSGFRERVLERAPLIIRRGLDAATADVQAAQLRAIGVEADVLPDTGQLAWLRRDGHIRGPLPADALACYAQPGDQWCHDGGQTWFAWTPEVAAAEAIAFELPATESPAEPAAVDAPLDATQALHGEPPPLPPSAPPRVPLSGAPVTPASKPPLSTVAVVAGLIGLLAILVHALAPIALLLAIGALIYLYRRPLLRGRPWAVAALLLSAVALCLWLQRPAPQPVAQPYVPRPLKPLNDTTAVAANASTLAQCAAKAPEPKSEEDRFLLTGQRLLTGRAQRKGDTYVAEAAVAVDPQCQPSALQLYVFRHGVLIGTALDTAATLAHTRLDQFDLIDDQHLRITLAQCGTEPGSCATATVRQIAVMPGGGGWTLGEIK